MDRVTETYWRVEGQRFDPTNPYHRAEAEKLLTTPEAWGRENGEALLDLVELLDKGRQASVLAQPLFVYSCLHSVEIHEKESNRTLRIIQGLEPQQQARILKAEKATSVLPVSDVLDIITAWPPDLGLASEVLTAEQRRTWRGHTLAVNITGQILEKASDETGTRGLADRLLTIIERQPQETQFNSLAGHGTVYNFVRLLEATQWVRLIQIFASFDNEQRQRVQESMTRMLDQELVDDQGIYHTNVYTLHHGKYQLRTFHERFSRFWLPTNPSRPPSVTHSNGGPPQGTILGS